MKDRKHVSVQRCQVLACNPNENAFLFLSIVAHRGIRHFDVDPTWLGLSLNLLLLRPSRFRDGLASLFLLSSTLLLYLQIFGWGFTRPKRCCLIDEAPVVVP